MSCSKCEVILDLDNYPLNNQPSSNAVYLHHQDYKDLRQAALDGCLLCQFIRSEWLKAVKFDESTLEQEKLSWRSRIFVKLTAGHWLHFDQTRSLNIQRLRLTIRLTALEENLATGICRNPRYLLDSSSSACFTLASYWLNRCLVTHDCPKVDQNLPNRVVDVGSDTSTPFLHISRLGESGHWLTLSHRWGEQAFLKTTKETLQERCRGLPFSTLPPAFRDAIVITRRLGYRYLWIDSLCILQGDAEDWLRESKEMARIYLGAILNISADASEGDHQGIFDSSNRGRGLVTEHPLTFHSSKLKTQHNLYVHSVNLEDPGKSPLQQRAWVLQESVLSPRRLRYSNGQLHWNCDTITERTCSEFAPHEIDNIKDLWSSVSVHRFLRKVLPDRIDITQEKWGDSSMIFWWYNQLNDYTQRRITFSKDRFDGIAALAKTFSWRTGYRYKAGIWIEDILRGLLWRNQSGRVDSNYSPSWSWATIDPDDQSPRSLAATYSMRHLEVHWVSPDPNWPSPEAYLLAINTREGFKWSGTDPFGVGNKDLFGDAEFAFSKVMPASLTLRGHCRSLMHLDNDFTLLYSPVIGNDEPIFLHDEAQERKEPGGPQKKIMKISLDESPDIKQVQSFFSRRGPMILHIAGFSDRSHQETVFHALVLLPNENTKEKEYRRVGIAHVYDADASVNEQISRWRLRTLRLV